MAVRTRVRCYDSNFLLFLSIFGEKIGVFAKTNVKITFLFEQKKRQIFGDNTIYDQNMGT
jgi:hypothetical protein